jgi:hypothetical protein
VNASFEVICGMCEEAIESSDCDAEAYCGHCEHATLEERSKLGTALADAVSLLLEGKGATQEGLAEWMRLVREGGFL